MLWEPTCNILTRFLIFSMMFHFKFGLMKKELEKRLLKRLRIYYSFMLREELKAQKTVDHSGQLKATFHDNFRPENHLLDDVQSKQWAKSYDFAFHQDSLSPESLVDFV